MYDVLEGLNEEQKQAVEATEGYVRVIAGAGSGKTRALTHRYAYLVNELGVSASDILCVTFTNKAANEMKKRIRGMIGDNDTGLVCTFHGFCVQLLREDIHTINYPKNFIVLDDDDRETILKSVYEDSHIKSKNYTFDMARKDIDVRKTRWEHIPYLTELDINKVKAAYEKEKDIKKKVFLGYLYEQKKCFGLDYEDLITVALHILENFEEKRIKWQERMMYVMVDEFQDVSPNQYALAEILSGYHKNLFIVGDPDQTIYTWRGADVKFILDFDKTHENTKTLFLNRNYRSTPEILNASNSLISKNQNRIEKSLEAVRKQNVPVIYSHAKTTAEEAEWIVQQIRRILAGGRKYGDIAILYRSHFVSRSIEEIFIKEKIPYVLYSGVEFYKRKEIKDALSYLRMLVNADDLSLQRVINEPKRNIGKKRMGLLKDYAQQHQCTMYEALLSNMEHPLIQSTKAQEFVNIIDKYGKWKDKLRVSELLSGILNDSGYEAMLRLCGEQERLDNLAELKQSIFEFERSSGEENALEDYLQSVALFTNTDKEERKNTVKLMTVHTAKGLEFPYVFVCSLNEGIFPSKHVDSIERLEEERRLAYVAFTRAENELLISDAEGINYDGSYRYPSRFIFNTGKEHLQYVVELDDHLMESTSRYIVLNELKMKHTIREFQIGDEVVHKIFGKGKILDVKEEISAYVIQFENMETPRNISKTAGLERAEA